MVNREIVIDLMLPASFPSRYRAELVSVTRNEARVRFRFSPSVFRNGELAGCDAELLVVLGRRTAQAWGELLADRGAVEGCLRFHEPVALPDYSLFREVCRAGGGERVLAESEEVEPPAASREPIAVAAES